MDSFLCDRERPVTMWKEYTHISWRDDRERPVTARKMWLTMWKEYTHIARRERDFWLWKRHWRLGTRRVSFLLGVTTKVVGCSYKAFTPGQYRHAQPIYGSVAQRQEASDLKSLQGVFESLQIHHPHLIMRVACFIRRTRKTGSHGRVEQPHRGTEIRRCVG